MTLIIGVVLFLAIAGVLLVARAKPERIEIRRVTEIKASREKVFALIDDFHSWPKWEPLDRSDPTMKRTFGGQMRGKGATSEWTSKGRAGVGRMEITESSAPERLKVLVDFAKPFRAHNVNQFALESVGEGTKVTWSMQGTNPFIARLMSVFVNMDRVMGKHFEEGLEALKRLSEQ
ncbi:MAG TPA: SRPBCC family protein [Bacteroidota bacterium]|nr:SRPBCC family protein [Bacteroidota bacterium]